MRSVDGIALVVLVTGLDKILQASSPRRGRVCSFASCPADYWTQFAPTGAGTATRVLNVSAINAFTRGEPRIRNHRGPPCGSKAVSKLRNGQQRRSAAMNSSNDSS